MFIGVVANSSNVKQIKKDIIENLKSEVISINSKSIENVKNIKFETIIIQDLMENLKDKTIYLKEILKNTKYILLNSDLIIDSEIFENVRAQIITYGLKQKSTITMSSIENNPAIISIQRSFKNLKGEIIEQQEIPIKINENQAKKTYNLLIKTAIINIYGGKKC